MPARLRRCAGQEVMLRPSSRMSPEQRTIPVMASIMVVFPAPLGPMSPTRLPGSTAKLTESTAVTPP